MKKLIIGSVILLLFAGIFAAIPFSPPFESASQMWNTSNVYNNIASSGTFIDTGTNTTALNLQTAALHTGKVNADTFTPAPIPGYGSITFTSYVLKCTNSPTITVTPMGSLDGSHYIAIPGATVQTVTPTSLTVPVNIVYNFPLSQAAGGKSFLFYQLQFAGSATSTYSVQSYWYFQKPVTYSKSF